jgi:SAM-dependent methyltransferase
LSGPPYRYSQRVDNYIKYRPRYPAAVLELLINECGLNRGHLVADIGSGTGILSELFLQNGNRVFGVEPDPDMRAGGEYYLQAYDNFTTVAATAEATGLPAGKVDFVTAGQAFHWFDLQKARREFSRILAPDGWVVLVWNVQKARGTPFLEALQQFWQERRFSKASRSTSPEQRQRAQALRLDPKLARQELMEPFFGPGSFKERFFPNPLVCNLEQLQGRVLSNGTSLEPGDELYPAMLAALEELLWIHQEDGRVTIEHDTRVIYGRLFERALS